MIQPYFTAGDVTIYHGDANKLLAELSFKAHACITDPPYLITDLAFDRALDMAWVKLLQQRVQDNGYLVSFGTQGLQYHIHRGGWAYRFEGVWLKSVPIIHFHNTKMPNTQSEPYIVYAHPAHTVSGLTWNPVTMQGEPYKKIQRLAQPLRAENSQIDRLSPTTWTADGYEIDNDGWRYVSNVIYGPNKSSMRWDERTLHPTQKPLRVLRVLIRWLTNPGDLIVDPFGGSGSTAVAALLEKRRCISIELDEQWCETGAARIEKAMQRQPLFYTEELAELYSEVRA